MSFCIEEELAKLPAKPGVYIMHDDRDEIIYVGKARILRNRVRQYFQSSRNKSLKIQQMVTHIARFEYIVTDNELEALILECNLIKENRPRYNTLLKDDKAYPYIRVTVEEDYPRVLFSRNASRGKSRYFGPFSSAGSVKETIELVRKLFNLRSCSKDLSKLPLKERPCLYHHIGQCQAPCQGNVPKEEYRARTENALAFLSGNYGKTIDELTGKMREASDAMDFEKAAEYRDLIASVRHIGSRQKANTGSFDDSDVIAVARKDDEAIAQVFFIRDGKLLKRENFHLHAAPDENDGEIMQGFLKQYYMGMAFVPGHIMISEEITDAELLEKWLSGKAEGTVKISVPKRGKKEKLVELAKKNAMLILDQDLERVKKEEERTAGAVAVLGERLGIEPPERMEAYDISNISGFQSVGSMVVYIGGAPKRSEYRKFRIRSVDGPDDYASMREVLTRRFKRALDQDAGFEALPDLLLMDGGKGQVNSALQVCEELGIDIPVCGMVKDDHHRTRGLYYKDKEILFTSDEECFKLITRIQDEVHRFAITYHRLLRGKGQTHSVLDDIPFIGPNRRKELIKHFRNIDEIKAASAEELAALPSMDRRSAESVYRYFHGSKEEEHGTSNA